MAPCVFGIANYKIVYPDGEGELYHAALNIQKDIKAKTGCDVPVLSDSTPIDASHREIVIGNANREVGSADFSDKAVQVVVSENGNIAIVGVTNYDILVACDSFVDNYVNTDRTMKLDVEFFVADAAQKGTKIKVMSFNVLGWTETKTDVYVGDTYYAELGASVDRSLRKEAVLQTVLSQNADSFGLQEFNIEWAKLADNGNSKWNYDGDTVYAPNIEKYVFANIPGYAAVGKPNENPSFSYNAIFYRTDTWECIEWNTKWLSPTPDVQFSEFEGTYEVQSCSVTYAVLKHKVTGEIYVHYNTHLTIDRTILDEQIDALKAIIEATSDGRHYVVTGDFNIDSATWSEYDTVKTYWDDARLCADTSSDRTENMIDYCVVSDGIYVETFKNMTEVKIKKEWKSGDDTYYVSDHHPLYTEFYIY